MEQLNYTIPCLFGVESVVGNQLKRLNINNISVENGRVQFSGNIRDMARANLWVRSGERVLIKLGEFPARTFTELFDNVLELPWESFIPKDGEFPVKGHALHSQLHSVPDCQSIIKKAVVERLKRHYHLSWFEETGSKYQIQFSIMKDIATLYIDTSGAGLHKRGYRAISGGAPLRETLAAAMVELTHYRGREVFCDPFCGSGTILIEAAMIAQNRAPGLYRHFAAEKWNLLPPQAWKELRAEAKEKMFDRPFVLRGGDTDPSVLDIARSNALKAGVAQYIKFEKANACSFTPPAESGIILTNPPYGERLLDQQAAQELYRGFGKVMRNYPKWKSYVITSEPEFERFYGKRAAKRRKLYNGMIKCELFMYN